MTLYRVELLIETPYNPAKWDWDELVASEESERVEFVSVSEEKNTAHMTLYRVELPGDGARMTEREAIRRLLEIFPNMTLGEDNSGQLIVHTDTRLLGDVLVPFENEFGVTA